MLSVLFQLSVLTSMLDCGPPLDYEALDQFVTFAGRIPTPMVQTSVHIPQNEDFDKKRETLQRYVEGWDKFPCKLTNRFDKDTSECFGFLRLALVDHKTLDAMSSLPMVRQLRKITPLWVENEREVLMYLHARLTDYKSHFETELWEDELALADMRETNQRNEEYFHLEKQVGARVISEFWLKVSAVLEKIYTILDSNSSTAKQLEPFTNPEKFSKFLAEELTISNMAFTFDTHAADFANLFESYFVEQTGIWLMIQEEMEAIAEVRLKRALRHKKKPF